jgi:putative membrane protein
MQSTASEPQGPPPAVRSLVGGILMGFANLVPGISGGTLILAIGLYDRFVGALADLSRMRPTRDGIVFLAWVGLGAVLAVVTLSSLLVNLVIDHRWAMYSLFVGMTLGGVPMLWKAIGRWNAANVIAAALGFAVMAWVAFGMSDTRLPTTIPVLIGVGALAASSMILPGISGSYLLLILGLYEVVIGSLSRDALQEDFLGSVRIVAPVLAGAALGMALLSNLLRYVLGRFPSTAHAALLGLLCGSVLGLYPFQQPVEPELASKANRRVVAMADAGSDGEAIRAKYGEGYDEARILDLTTRFGGEGVGALKRRGEALERFGPSGARMGQALGLFLLGLLVTRFFGRGESKPGQSKSTA